MGLACRAEYRQLSQSLFHSDRKTVRIVSSNTYPSRTASISIETRSDFEKVAVYDRDHPLRERQGGLRSEIV